jgi:hypothetical protein
MAVERNWMLAAGGLLLWLYPAQTQTAKPEEVLIREIAASGRCAVVAESADERVKPLRAVTPGQPPLLSFRYYEGKLHHRYNNSDLMLDDAGH